MTSAIHLSHEHYIRQQIAIMTGVLEQMTDHYAMVRLRMQIQNLETELLHIVNH